MDYELYHDESLEGGYWHGMLLVPLTSKPDFAKLLQTARLNTRHHEKIGIKNVVRKGPIYSLASAWAQIGAVGLRSSTKGRAEPVFLGGHEKGAPRYEKTDLHGLKFILFRERDAHKHLTGFRDHASKIETTFRFGIKGGLHLLGSDENPIHITRIHFDGHQHHQRHIDQERIVARLGSLRKYCTISRRQDLIDDRHSDHRRPEGQEPEDCQFLQLTDILIGCFRTSLGFQTRTIHGELARPIQTLVDKYHEGYARMKKSRWANSFAISQCYLENGKWVFEGIQRNQNASKQPQML